MQKRFLSMFFLLLVGCHQNYEEGAHPPPIPPQQPAQMPANHPPPASPQTGMQSQTPQSSGDVIIAGTISLDPKLADQLPERAILYIIARPAPTGGPPLAIKRLSLPEFPFEYSLTNADAGMMPGQEVNLGELDALYISVKIDLDGKVGPAEPGDMEGVCAGNPVMPGTMDAHVIIDKVF